jgi:SAM-dependent methyltransferase
MRLATQLLLTANRLLPAPALPGESDARSYAQWEYTTAGPSVELFQRALGAVPDARRALDLGCGLGGKTRRLCELTPALSWSALDVSQQHLRDAAAQNGRCADWCGGDAALLPFADGSFDVILSADTLEHLPDPKRALRELRRCLRPGGRVALLFNPWGSPRGSHLGDLLRLPWCQLWFDAPTLIEAARAEAARSATFSSQYADSLIDHFRDHVHPTRIADFRRWLSEDRQLEIESEMHVGPGRLQRARWIAGRPWEEWLSASYGAVLRPASNTQR